MIAGCSASVILAIIYIVHFVVITGCTKAALDRFQINFNALPNHMKYNLIS